MLAWLVPLFGHYTPREIFMAFRFLAQAATTIFVASALTACDPMVPRTSSASARSPNAPAPVARAPVAIEESSSRSADGPRAVTGAEVPSDPIITARIKASLLTDPAMAGADVSVNSDRGVVNLTGTVIAQEQAAIASAHAQRPDGVMRIDNHLSVNPR